MPVPNRSGIVFQASRARNALQARGANLAANMAHQFRDYIRNVIVGPFAWVEDIYPVKVLEVERIAGAFQTGRARVQGPIRSQMLTFWARFGDEESKPPTVDKIYYCRWPSKSLWGPYPEPWIKVPDQAALFLYLQRTEPVPGSGNPPTFNRTLWRIPWPPPTSPSGAGPSDEQLARWERDMVRIGRDTRPIFSGFAWIFFAGYSRDSNHFLWDLLGFLPSAGAPKPDGTLQPRITTTPPTANAINTDVQGMDYASELVLTGGNTEADVNGPPPSPVTVSAVRYVQEPTPIPHTTQAVFMMGEAKRGPGHGVSYPR
jgi:hypothetical protein